jgi:anti-sigma B factor antagonist
VHHIAVHTLVRLVVVTGVLDLTTAPVLKAQLLSLLNGGVRRLVVELTRSSEIDSSGLAVLVGVRKRLDRLGGSLVIVIDNEHVAHRFAAVGLDRFLTVAGSREEALAALGMTHAV